MRGITRENELLILGWGKKGEPNYLEGTKSLHTVNCSNICVLDLAYKFYSFYTKTQTLVDGAFKSLDGHDIHAFSKASL